MSLDEQQISSIEPLDFGDFVGNYAKQVHSALDAIENQWGLIYQAVRLIRECKGTVWLIGNGGSAALAAHMATDLQLAGVRAIALTDVAAITTYANDFHFARVFEKQLETLARDGDIIIAISGSGTSSNLVEAVRRMYCKESDHGIPVIAITGGTCKVLPGGHLGLDAKLHINIPSEHMGISQDGHQIVLHIITYFLMSQK